jgi:hypothetical protein
MQKKKGKVKASTGGKVCKQTVNQTNKVVKTMKQFN